METYYQGDKTTYTGKTRTLYGGLFYELLILEGIHEGETAFTATAPVGVSPFVERNKKEWEDNQKDFRKLKDVG